MRRIVPILSRYILRQHIGPFLFGLSVIIFIFLTNFILQNLYRFVGKGLNLSTILEVIVLNMAWIVALAVPMSVLMAAVMTFGRFSEDNEITAIQSGGISPFRIIRPVLIAAIVMSLCLIWFNNNVLPEANHRARLLMTDIYRAKPVLTFQEGVFSTQIPDMRILIRKINPVSSHLAGIVIFDNTESPIRRTIIAEEGSFVYASGIDRLMLTLIKGEIHEVNPEEWDNYVRLKFDRHIISVPMEESGLQRTQSGYKGDREKSAGEMQNEVKIFQREIQEYRNTASQLLDQSGLLSAQPLQKAIDSLSSMLISKKSGGGNNVLNPDTSQKLIQERIEQLGNLSALIENRADYIRKLSVEIHKKYSIPVACIVFVLIGAPLGMIVRKGGIAFSGGISLGFFIIYWAFLIGGEELADRGFVHPVIAMWAANLLLGGLAAWWLCRIMRISNIVSMRAIFKKLWH